MIIISSCQTDLDHEKSDQAYRKGLETIQVITPDGQPDYKKAHKYFSMATSLNEDNIAAQYWKADTELKLGRFKDALGTAHSVFQNLEGEGHNLLPQLYLLAGISAKMIDDQKISLFYLKKAVKIYQTRIEGNRDNLDAIFNKAIVLCYMDEREKAMHFLDSISINQRNQDLVNQMKADISTFDLGEVLNELAGSE